jgi:hypothetical protein
LGSQKILEKSEEKMESQEKAQEEAVSFLSGEKQSLVYLPCAVEPIYKQKGKPIERAFIIRIFKNGGVLLDALQVAKVQAKVVFKCKNVRFTDILRVSPGKYIVLVQAVQIPEVGRGKETMNG